MKQYLKKCAEQIEIKIEESKLNQFQIFYDMLMEANRSFNLTAITQMQEVVQKHFIDSIVLSKNMNLFGKKGIDVGTGAGFPGLPLAILYPDVSFVLLDSLKKRLAFIDSVVEKCNIKNVITVHGRAEDFGQDPRFREQFDFCVSRAVAPLPVLLELCIPFVRVGGVFVSYKSEKMEEELIQAKNALSVLHCELGQQYTYKIPDSDFYRALAFFYKNRKLEKKYPRQAGKPKKNPL